MGRVKLGKSSNLSQVYIGHVKERVNELSTKTKQVYWHSANEVVK